MKKEVILAIVIGLILGLLITFGIYTARTALTKAPTASQEKPLVSPSPEPTESATITITSPATEALIDTETVTITGKTLPESTVTLVSDSDQQLVATSADGSFTADFELAGGINQIVISAFTPEGKQAETTLTLVYSTAAL